jgi:UMP-CMP kinase
LTLAATEKAKLGNTMAEAEAVLETVNRSLNSTLGEDDREDSGIADEMGESNIALYEVGTANEIDEDFDHYMLEEDGGGKEKKGGVARVQVEDVLEEASHGMSDANNAAAGVVVVDGLLPPASTFALIEDQSGGKSHSMVKAEGKATVQDLKSSTAVDVYAKEIEIAGAKDLQFDANTAEKRRKPQVVFVLGGPGVGKGTQCANIVKKYGWCHLSAGDLLRAERATASADADLINSCIKEGKLVPVEITVKLLLAAMQQSKTQSFLLDGFPRSIDNYEGWCAAVGDQADVACCLFYECGLGELERRLLDRGKTSGRDDDNIQSIKKRFITFMNETSPIVEVCVCVCVCGCARGRVRVCCGMSGHALMQVK